MISLLSAPRTVRFIKRIEWWLLEIGERGIGSYCLMGTKFIKRRLKVVMAVYTVL